MSKHFTVPFSVMLATPGVPISYEFWLQVVAKVRKMKMKLTVESAHTAIWELRKEAHVKLEAAEKARLAAVQIFNDCRAVERDVAVLMGLTPATMRRSRKTRAHTA